MKVEVRYTFSCNSSNQREFPTKKALLEYIKTFEVEARPFPSKTYEDVFDNSHIDYIGIGAYLICNMDEFYFQTNVGYQHTFYIAEQVLPNQTGKQVKVLNPKKPNITEIIPVDDRCCVLNKKTLQQIYPPVDKFKDSHLGKFIQQIQLVKRNLEKVK